MLAAWAAADSGPAAGSTTRSEGTPDAALTLRLDDHRDHVRELVVRDPTTGACSGVRLGSSSRPSCHVAPGRWRATAVLWSGDVIQAHGDVAERTTWTLER